MTVMATTLSKVKQMLTKDEHRRAMFALSIATISSPAESRMRMRTAKEQLAAALAEANREQSESIPDADDESTTRAGVLL